MSDGRVLLAVDGGGTKTAARVATAEGVTLGQGAAGSSNFQKVGFAAATGAIEAAIAEAWRAAARAPRPPAAVCLGLSGVDREQDARMWEAWLRALLPQSPACVVNDAELLLAAGTPHGWGVGMICGTGATCVGRNPAGRFARADGWGYILGDDGSGYAIGRTALRAVMRAWDGRGPATLLTTLLLAHWRLADPEGLIDRIYVQDAAPAEIAGLAALVDESAAAGDGVALEILREAGRETARTIGAVVRALGLENPVPCALGGGVLLKSALMAGYMLDAAAAAGLGLDPVVRVAEPVEGAVRLAQRLL